LSHVDAVSTSGPFASTISAYSRVRQLIGFAEDVLTSNQITLSFRRSNAELIPERAVSTADHKDGRLITADYVLPKPRT